MITFPVSPALLAEAIEAYANLTDDAKALISQERYVRLYVEPEVEAAVARALRN